MLFTTISEFVYPQQIALKCSDLGHTAAELSVHKRCNSTKGFDAHYVQGIQSFQSFCFLILICIVVFAYLYCSLWIQTVLLILCCCDVPYDRWVSLLEEEFFRQGDKEKYLELPVSPLFDRSKPGVTKSQVCMPVHEVHGHRLSRHGGQRSVKFCCGCLFTSGRIEVFIGPGGEFISEHKHIYMSNMCVYVKRYEA